MGTNKGLGRGLDALLSNDEGSNDSLENCLIDNLITGKYQPRSHMDQIALNELAESIKTQGIMQPIIVRSVGDQKYEIVAGERRWRAAKLANLKKVPILIKDIPDESALVMALIENIQREDLNAIEIALSYERLLSECQLTQDQLSEKISKSRSNIANYIRLLKLPAEIQIGIRDRSITMGHARSLLSLNSEKEQIRMYKEIVSSEMSVRDIEQQIRNRKSSNKENRVSSTLAKKTKNEIK